MTFGPHLVSLYGLQHSAYVRFSVLALSSIFFLVDPFAALPTFLAITEGSDAARRRRIARKGALTTLIVLAAFAFAGEAIFRVLGITLPAFEIAGGVILLLIGLDMLQARRSATQEVRETPSPPRRRRTPELFHWACPCWPAPAPSPP